MSVQKWLDLQIELKNKIYGNAPARNKISVVIVNVNDTRIENIKAIILLSNHHQNAMHKKTIVIEKCRSLWNGIF
jgi:hypothetical protein